MTKHKTYKTLEDYRDYLVKDNGWAFNLDWDFSWSAARIEIVKIMDIKPGMDILEVGCANGKTLEFIKENYYVNLYGIEPDKELAKQAMRWAKIYPITVEKFLKTYTGNKFNAIIMADVIEHLREPWMVIRDLVKHLKDDGAIYASIPNFMHASVIWNLFACGSFAYSSNDIVNKEHLRFFTMNDIASLFKIAGLNKCIVSGIEAEFPLETIEKIKILGNVFGRDDYYFNIYQFIVKATRE